MSMGKGSAAGLKIAVAIAIGGFALSGCATKKYVREYVASQIEPVNVRITAAEAGIVDARGRADAAAAAAQAAASAAQGANAAAQAAAADARAASGRIDQLTTRVDTVEQSMVRRRARN
jgi:murein lipoprotein